MSILISTICTTILLVLSTRLEKPLPISIFLLIPLLIISIIANQMMYHTRIMRDIGKILIRFILIMALPTSLVMSPENSKMRLISLFISLINMMVTLEMGGGETILIFYFIFNWWLQKNQNCMSEIKLTLVIMYWCLIIIYGYDKIIFANPINSFDVSTGFTIFIHNWFL